MCIRDSCVPAQGLRPLRDKIQIIDGLLFLIHQFFFFFMEKASRHAIITIIRTCLLYTSDAARRALRLADAAIQRLGAQVNPKIVLSVFAAKFRAL